MVAPCRYFRGHAARSCSFGVTKAGVHHVAPRLRVRIRDRFAFASVTASCSPSSRILNADRVASEDRRSNPLPGLVTLIGPATIPDRASRARPLLRRWIGWIVATNNPTLALQREDCLTGLLVLLGQPSIRATKSAAIVGCWPVGATSNDWIMRTSLCLLYTSPSPRDRTRSRMPSSA